MTHEELKLFRRTYRKPYTQKYDCTQTEMAEILGISRSQYARYEAGKPISKTVLKLLEKLKIS